jgi:hypothetical protein
MGTVTFLAPAIPQWVWPELKLMGVLRRLLGNESPFGWCDFITSAEPDGPCAEFCDHFGPVVRLTRVDRRYEVTCLRTGASKRTTNLERAAALIRARWSAGVHAQPQAQCATKPVEILPALRRT